MVTPPSSRGGTPRATLRWRPVFLAAVRFTLGLALVVFLLKRWGASSLNTLPSALWLLVAFNVCTLIGAATEGRRLEVLLAALDIEVTFSIAFRLVAIATLFSFWIPGGTGGDVMKLYYLAGRNKGRGIEVATALLVDRIVALYTLLVLILGLLVLQPGLSAVPLVWWLGIGTALAVAGLTAGTLMLWSDRLRASHLYVVLIARLPLARYLVRAADSVYVFRAKKSALARVALLCLAGHVILAASLALTGFVLLPAVSSLASATLALLGIVANVLPVTPGGLGVGEAATEALFHAVGASGGALIVVVWRIGTAALCVLGAGFYMVGIGGRDSRTEPRPPARQDVQLPERSRRV